MLIGVIGMNHKSAPLSLREAFANALDTRFGAELSCHGALRYVLLSTCNRTELYFSAEDLADAHIYLLDALRKEMAKPFEHAIYSYFGFDCFFHLAEVTSGIDSAHVGETEIQGQVKNAYEQTSRSLSKELHFLFQKSLKIGKKIRTCFKNPKNSTLEQSVLNSASYILGDLARQAILFVGISEINLKLLAHFKASYGNNITLCNRTCSKAKILSEKERVNHLLWNHLYQWEAFDLIIVGTKAKHYLIKEMQEELKKPKLIVDLSVPRNVNPHLRAHILNIDHLRPKTPSQITSLPRQMIKRATETQLALFARKSERFALHIA